MNRILETPIDYVKIANGKKYLITASGGNISIERMLPDNTWIPVQGSPLLNGEEKELYTATADPYGRIRLKASTANTYYSQHPAD